ncbi:MAG: TolC family protein [Chitinispirillales bacterium]|jgi:outer membrane protein TolC|nr:TolC family protein [Chitinispirillales bacterium]
MFCVILIILILSSAAFAADYSLNELVDSAYKHSHLLSIADLQIEKNKEFVDESKRHLLPAVTFTGNYNYAITPYNSMAKITDESPASFTEFYKKEIAGNFPYKAGDTLITGMLDYLISGFSEITPRNTISGGIDLRQTFFAQNKFRHSINYARIQGRALICYWQDVRMKVKADMTKLYYSALIAKEQTLIEKQSRDIAESRHNQTVLLFNSHILSEIDTLNSFVDFSSSAIRLAESQRHNREIYHTIALSAGISNSDSITLSDTLSISGYRFDYDVLQQHFLEENKDLRLLANEVDLAEIRAAMAKDDYYPIIYGGISLNKVAQFDNLNKFDDFSFEPDRKLYLGISYDITTFGRRRLKVKQSEYDLKIAKHNYENKKEQLLIQLKSNFEAINEEYAKVEESKKILDASQKALVLAQNRFSDGLISQMEMDIFEQRFRQSGLVYLSAVLRYNSALIDLRIMGADYLYEFSESFEK